MPRAHYLKPNRLEDVIFLIQYLGLGNSFSLATNQPERGAEGVRPRSARSWDELAEEHPEFFRLTDNRSVTLGYRYYLRDGNGNPQRLAVETVQGLVDNAMSLHDRQAKRVEVWKTWVTMLAAVAAAATGIANLFWK